MDDFGVNLEEVQRVVERASVLVIRFQVTEKRLLVDFRSSPQDRPLVMLVPRVSSAEARFRHLKTLRPALPLPDRIHSFVWPRGLGAFKHAGVMGWLQERLQGMGAEQAAEDMEVALEALKAEERALLRAAINGGEGFQTLWERSA